MAHLNSQDAREWAQMGIWTFVTPIVQLGTRFLGVSMTPKMKYDRVMMPPSQVLKGIYDMQGIL